MSNTKSSRLGKSIWFNLVVFGFIGQIAWAVENVYFNTFLFNYIGGSTSDISRMVALSAATAVITTFLMGALSDKLAKRKPFICIGYIVWGCVVALFAPISRENVASLFNISDTASVIAVTVSIVIILDCVMTFMGSTGNDAAFNAWLTDVTSEQNRATAEGALAVMPILATLIVTAAFGAGVTAFGYPACFLGLGGVVVLCGIVGLFTIKEVKLEKNTDSNYFADIIYGFRPSVISENKYFYLTLISSCFFLTAVQVFMPYIFIYIQHYLKFDFNSLLASLSVKTIIIAAAALIGFIAVVVICGKMLDKFGKKHFIFPSIAVFIIGLILVSRMESIGKFALCACVMLCGYGLLTIILNAAIRDFTPEGKAGLFQGVRMIFAVLIPMVVGSAIGSRVTEAFADNHELGTYINEFGETVNVPVPEIFIFSAIVAVFIVIPIVFLRKKIR